MPGEAVIRITTTTICGTDVHIVRGEYPVRPGLVLGHEPVGVIEELGAGLEEIYTVGQRVIVGAITPCGQCFYCLNGAHSQCGGALGGWRFGNTINGAWAEYLLVPDARANLAPIPDGADRRRRAAVSRHLLDRPVAAPRAATSRSATRSRCSRRARSACARPLGAKLKGASLIIGIDSIAERLEVARRFGANVTLNIHDGDPVAGDQAADRRPRRRRRDRGARPPGDVRERAARDPARRHAVEPRRVFGQARRALRGALRRASAIRRSSRRSVPAARSGCAG